ncbi:hypothetical protein SAMN00120144_3032 [Hymenobacter roseosalivarius DSM 11622]|uniref:Lipocalin-like domain-containing protein n=1 Tax=Hymenobacter roseosalivarius DSM 11622 TaxID=645990 RepID=A0A1W1ULQ5_9BACT|nr:hypothetical protein [Hymenobacter roseosalivarius]SMB81929.1 hypothetical protein SAMN00120144_3032 [Hymenobacter roseosalivarius DSM 11622]
MKNLFHITLLLLLAGIFTACPKKSDPEAADPKTTLLINKDWRATADVSVTTTSAGASTTTDNYAALAACGKDDFIRFNDNNVLEINEGPSKCSPADQQTAKGTWSWNADRTVITFTEPCLCPNFPSTLSGPADLTSSTLVVKQTSTNNGSTTVRTVTYGSI